MCCGIYIVQENGKLAKKRYFGSCYSFCYYNQKNITSIAVPAQTCLRQKKNMLAQAYKCIFRPENGCSSKMIIARHTTNRQSFKKVTCPQNMIEYKIFSVLLSMTASHQAYVICHGIKAHIPSGGYLRIYVDLCVSNRILCTHFVLLDPIVSLNVADI